MKKTFWIVRRVSSDITARFLAGLPGTIAGPGHPGGVVDVAGVRWTAQRAYSLWLDSMARAQAIVERYRLRNVEIDSVTMVAPIFVPEGPAKVLDILSEIDADYADFYQVAKDLALDIRGTPAVRYHEPVCQICRGTGRVRDMACLACAARP